MAEETPSLTALVDEKTKEMRNSGDGFLLLQLYGGVESMAEGT